jgi:hypothetical protein
MNLGSTDAQLSSACLVLSDSVDTSSHKLTGDDDTAKYRGGTDPRAHLLPNRLKREKGDSSLISVSRITLIGIRGILGVR